MDDCNELHLVEETPQIYNEVTLNFIKEIAPTHNQWIYNTLERKRNADKIVFEDPCPENGFVLLPDIVWDGTRKNLCLLALVHQKGIKSLRDLNESHLPLLNNLLHSGSKAIQEKFGFRKSQLRIYFHYQPTYYHLHLHFDPLDYDAPGSMTEKSHLIQGVIYNIQKNPGHYQETVLNFRTRNTSKLYSRLLEYGYEF